VRDLHEPRPAIYWTDLAVTAVVGWGAFGVALMARPFSAAMCAAIIVAAFALYRGLCFVHEISHLRQRCLRGFEIAWNFVFGIPLLLPSFVYVGVHASHHSLAIYGTDRDPEYLPFARSHRMSLGFFLHSILLPAAFLFRFFVLSPIGLCWPRFHNWLIARASSLSMNPAYRRENSPELTATVKYGEFAILVVWMAASVVAWRHDFLLKGIAVWYAISAVVSVCNSLRTLGAHRYESAGTPLDRAGQLVDSIDTPGAAWTELWAPVGLRYHALHHYFPGIPYHNLGLAYERLISTLPASAGYREITSPSLPFSLRRLYAAGKAAFRKRRNREIHAPALRSGRH
jgi:fatty acid desaturase